MQMSNAQHQEMDRVYRNVPEDEIIAGKHEVYQKIINKKTFTRGFLNREAVYIVNFFRHAIGRS